MARPCHCFRGEFAETVEIGNGESSGMQKSQIIGHFSQRPPWIGKDLPPSFFETKIGNESCGAATEMALERLLYGPR